MTQDVRDTMSKQKWNRLNRSIIHCERCPRLIAHCRTVAREKRRAYIDEDYFGAPVPNFGDPRAELLLVGLAPGAHGANRTGRMFTGDRSGDWLYRALYHAGFANQPESRDSNDGLELSNCAVTNVCHCAPPQNKPTREEVHSCQSWLESLMDILPVKVVLALGGIAWNATFDYFKSSGVWQGGRPTFSHGGSETLSSGIHVLGSYHPSQQNTFTRRLTRPMLNRVFQKARRLLD